MRRIHLALAALGAAHLLFSAKARGSDPVGVYALVERVVLEPGDKAPDERIQVWGAFSLAKGYGDTYAPPARGYLYYALSPGKKETCLNEWNDLKGLAGSGECVAFGSRYKIQARVRKAGEKPGGPDPYPLAFGLTRLRSEKTDYPPIRALLLLPAPLSPPEGSAVQPGKVTVIARNALARDARKAKYVFEIERASGEREESGPLEPGEKETRWTPRMEVKAGERYSWRVRVEAAGWKGPIAGAEFQGKQQETSNEKGGRS